MYEYISSKSLVNFERSNYLSLDLGELLPGNYIISVSLIIGNDSHVKTLPATIGYYGSGVFAIKRENAIDDKEFLCKTLLNRARRPEFTSSLRKPLEKASGWSCIEKIQDSNFCYIAYRIEASSDYENYRIYVDSKYLAYDLAGKMTNFTSKRTGRGRIWWMRLWAEGRKYSFPSPTQDTWPTLIDFHPQTSAYSRLLSSIQSFNDLLYLIKHKYEILFIIASTCMMCREAI